MLKKILVFASICVPGFIFGQKFITQIELESPAVHTIQIMPYNDPGLTSYIGEGIAQENPGLTVSYGLGWPKPYILRSPLNVLLTHDAGKLNVVVVWRDAEEGKDTQEIKSFSTEYLKALGDTNRLIVAPNRTVSIEPLQ